MVIAIAVVVGTSSRGHADHPAVPGTQCRVAESAPGGPITEPVSVVGDDGGVLLMAPVCVDGYGPFPFVVDTGASRSAISAALATQLHLPAAGAAVKIDGVACAAEAVPSEVDSWSLGDLSLAGQTLLAVDLPGHGHITVDGLLGSDVLSRFDAVRIDYRQSQIDFPNAEHDPPDQPMLVNYARPDLSSAFTGPTDGEPVELSVVEAPESATALVAVQLPKTTTSFYVDTGAAISAVDQVDAATLTSEHRTVPLTTAGCVYQAPIVSSGTWSIGGRPPLLGKLGSSSVDQGRDRDIPLAASALASVPLPSGSGAIQVHGSVGSDVLSQFQSVVIDYRDAALLLADG